MAVKIVNLEKMEAQVPELALEALREAARKARASNRTMVSVEDGKLVERRNGSKPRVLKAIKTGGKLSNLRFKLQ